MNRTKFALALGLLLGLFAAAPLGAANPPKASASWDNLKALAPGDDVRIVLNDKKSYRGKFHSATDNAIVARLAKGDQTFDRTNILRVSTKGQSHRLRNALLGAAVGAGIMAVAGLAAPSDQKEYVYIGVPVVAAWGAGIGAFVPTGGWHDVYRAR